MTLNSYATALTNALQAAGITGTTVSATASGQLSITGANISTSGSLIQDPVASANAAGTLTFNSSGTPGQPGGDVSNISFSGLSDGAAPLNMTWNVVGSNGASTIAQNDATSATSSPTQNGLPSAPTRALPSARTAQSPPPTQTAKRRPSVNWRLPTSPTSRDWRSRVMATTRSRQPVARPPIGVSGTDGLGTINDSELEMSNVNISAEFSDLIIAQRAFEANSKAITTFDTITQETINMIH